MLPFGDVNEVRRRPRRGLAKTMLAVLALCATAPDGSAREPGDRESLLRRIFGATKPPPEVSVSFRLLADIDLPGPLPDGNAQLVGGRVVIPVAGGFAITDWAPGSSAELLDTAPSGYTPEVLADAEDGEAAWSLDPSGRYRARFREDDTLVMQRRCRWLCSGWDKIWKLRVPGSRLGRPLLTETRVYFGALDNRVYSLRKRSGNRIWASDIQERPSRPVRLWEGSTRPADSAATGPDEDDAAERHRLILVLPDAGSRLLALDRRTGRIVARFELDETDGTLQGSPLTTPDDRILVAREKYRPDQASLMVLELTATSAARGPKRDESDPDEPEQRELPVEDGSREKKGGS